MSVAVVAQYRVQQGEHAAVYAALSRMVAPTRAEAGCLAYDVYVDPDDHNFIVLIEEYKDSEAFQSHLDSAHFESILRAEVLPRLAERVRFDLVPLSQLSA